MEAGRSTAADDSGYAMAALLVAMGIMALAMSIALPTWSTSAKREREAELIFRGQQYARAIALYGRKYANAPAPSFDLLLEQRFLRKKYKDPMTKDGEFRPLYAGSPGLGQAAGQGAAAQGGAGQVGAGQNGVGQGGARAGQGGIVPQQGQRGASAAPLGQAAGMSAQGGGLTGTNAGAQGGIIGVVSKSDDESLRLYNGRQKYSEWAFLATDANVRAGRGAAGAQNPTGGVPGRGGPQAPGGVPEIGGLGRGGRGQDDAGRGGRGNNGPGGRQQGPPPNNPFGAPGGGPFGGFGSPPGRGR